MAESSSVRLKSGWNSLPIEVINLIVLRVDILSIMLATVRFRVFWDAVPKQCSVNRRKGDQSLGVNLHEHPAAATIDEYHPRRVHADPIHTVNVVEGDEDQIAVKGVDARHPRIVMLRDTRF